MKPKRPASTCRRFVIRDDAFCASELLEPGEFDPSDAVSYYPQDREAGYILLCTAKARSNLRLRTHVQTEMRAHRKKIGLPAPYA
jgi:ferredoxin